MPSGYGSFPLEIGVFFANEKKREYRLLHDLSLSTGIVFVTVPPYRINLSAPSDVKYNIQKIAVSRITPAFKAALQHYCSDKLVESYDVIGLHRFLKESMLITYKLRHFARWQEGAEGEI